MRTLARRQPGTHLEAPPQHTLPPPQSYDFALRAADVRLGVSHPEFDHPVGPLPSDAFEPRVDSLKEQHMLKLEPGETIVLDQRKPVATAERVKQVTGLDLGALLGVMYLPKHETADVGDNRQRNELIRQWTRVYIFDQGWRGRGGSHRAEQPRHQAIIMGHNQLNQLVQSVRDQGRTRMPVRGSEMPVITPMQTVRVGRGPGTWLPLTAQTVEHDHRVPRNLYGRVSGLQAEVSMTFTGRVYVTGHGNAEKSNSTVVLDGPERFQPPYHVLPRPVDPWLPKSLR